MEEILQLLGSKPFCFLCKQIFLRQLPTVVRTQLIASDFSNDPRAVANQATMLWRAARVDNQFVSNTSVVPQPVAELSAATKPAKTPSAPTARDDWCYFHRRFGKAAKRCQNPCSFPGNARAGHQPQ